MLISPKQILEQAHRNNSAVGAFNVLNLETLKGVIAAAEETNIPLIIQITPGALQWADYDYLVPMVLSAIKKTKAQIALHLDHCQEIELLQKAVNDGFSSVMFDGSHFDFKENVELSLKAQKIAKAKNIYTEFEIGKIGGKEDNLIANDVEEIDFQTIQKFANLTKPDSLAFYFGTQHGIYKKETELNLELVKKVKKALNIPLVMHGTSGLKFDKIQQAIKAGINKINIATDLLIVYNQAILEYLNSNPKSYDIRKINTKGIEAIKNKVIQYLKIL